MKIKSYAFTKRKKLDINKKKKIRIDIDEDLFIKIIDEKVISRNYINWLNDYDTVKYTDQKHFKHSFKRVKNFILEKLKSKDDFLFGIFFKNEHIGNIKLGPINNFHKTSEVSYIIGNKNYWGKGIASKCLKEVIKYAFEKTDLEKITSGYHKLNKASGKVLEKNKFKIEGIRKKEKLFEGKRADYVEVGLIKE